MSGVQVVKTSKVLGNLKDCLPFSAPWKKGPEERARLSCKQKKVESKELANVSFQPIYSYIQSSRKIGDLIYVVKCVFPSVCEVSAVGKISDCHLEGTWFNPQPD